MTPHFSPGYFAFFGILFTMFTANAVMPPHVYKEMQKKSPEVLTIEAVTVKLEGASITVEAKIITVERSRSGLKLGDQIRIHYQTWQEGEPIATGSSWPIRLKKGNRYRSYLVAAEPPGSYGLSADGESFIEVPFILSPQ